MDALFRPWFVGNGRIWVSGYVEPGTAPDSIEWRVNEGSWVTGVTAPASGERFGFWVYGTTAGPDGYNVFQEGSEYTVDVRVTLPGPSTTVAITDTFIWHLTVQDTFARMKSVLVPQVLQDSATALTLFRAWAWAIGDLEAFFEDVTRQTFPVQATWALNLWEEELGIPSSDVASATIEQRRAFAMAKRTRRAGSRTDFFRALSTITTDLVITDQYALQRLDLRIGSVDELLQARLEALIADIKPAGIEVTISYGSFLADISEAGDVL